MMRESFIEQERPRSDVFGQYSRLYEYHDDRGRPYLVSCDFPFGPNWHELTVCYLGTGWELQERRVDNIAAEANAASDEWDIVTADFRRSDGTAAQLVYCVFDASGQPVPPPTGTFWDDAWQTVQSRHRKNDSRILYQVQVWTTADETVLPAQRQAARALLLEARQHIRDQISNTPPSQQSAPADSPAGG
jgi:hypothetical protein